MADDRPYKAAISDANLLANLGPPSQTLCTQCHEFSVDSLATPVRIYHHCRSSETPGMCRTRKRSNESPGTPSEAGQTKCRRPACWSRAQEALWMSHARVLTVKSLSYR